ncbi:MAG: hypothetical protein L6R40_007607 [Gallowayella cf. fulva]|nr:MAG: hypothetical protein L6R40_007607 [Xanthomendoza cf. fulva]
MLALYRPVYQSLQTHRFQGLRVTFDKAPKGYGTFSLEQIALGFIAALAEEATRDCDEPLPTLFYTYTDFPRPAPYQLTIRMRFLGHDPGESKRSNVNYALVEIPNKLLMKDHVDGTTFWEDRRGFAIYSGAFGDLPVTSNKTMGRSTMTSRHLSERGSFLDASHLFPPSNDNYRFSIDGTGSIMPKADIFISTLLYLLDLSQGNLEPSVEETAFYAASSPLWFYVRGGPQNPTFQLKVVAGILKIIATQLPLQGDK